jgi:lysyl-tRNA synthetase class II
MYAPVFKKNILSPTFGTFRYTLYLKMSSEAGVNPLITYALPSLSVSSSSFSTRSLMLATITSIAQLKTEASMKILSSTIFLIVVINFPEGPAIAELFEHYCEEHLLSPIHIIDHPKETTPLCKLHRQNPELIERDEPYVNASEAGNIYSELNDPILQEKLMFDQADQGSAKGENHPIDTDFIESLKYGMPPAYGLGLGIDRLVMIFTNSPNIREVILFPLLREEGDQ